MIYTPQPGTIPHRAIAHLQSLGEGAELATAVLCEEIGAQANGFHACMLPAQRQGLVRTTKKLRISYWSLGDGQPVVLAPVHEPDDPKDIAPPPPATTAEQMLSAWARPAPLPPGCHDMVLRTPATDDEAGEPEVFPEFVDSTDDEPFVCALWSDGRLQLQRGGDELALLSQEETRALLHYLERMAVEAD